MGLPLDRGILFQGLKGRPRRQVADIGLLKVRMTRRDRFAATLPSDLITRRHAQIPRNECRRADPRENGDENGEIMGHDAPRHGVARYYEAFYVIALNIVRNDYGLSFVIRTVALVVVVVVVVSAVDTHGLSGAHSAEYCSLITGGRAYVPTK